MSYGRKAVTILTIVLVAVTLNSAQADEVLLKNGDRITGKVVRLENNKLIFTTPYAGDVSINWEHVTNIQTDDPVKVILTKDTVVQGKLLSGETGWVTVKSDEIKDAFPVELTQFKVINPKPPSPALKTTARVNVGVNVTSGNTETESIYGDAELIARTEKNRYSLGAVYKRKKDNDVTTADSLLGYMKYDYFIQKQLYFYANAGGEKDKFKDLNLRTSLGLGAGYQFFETEITNLSFEAGVSYVNEDFIVSEDNDYAAGRWEFNFDHYFFNKALQFFHKHTGLQSLEKSDDLVIYSQTGFRVPFYKNLNITAQVNYDYDKSPAAGKEKDDQTYILSIGYEWQD